MAEQVQSSAATQQSAKMTRVPQSVMLKRILGKAHDLAVSQGQEYYGTEHFFQAATTEPDLGYTITEDSRV